MQSITMSRHVRHQLHL